MSNWGNDNYAMQAMAMNMMPNVPPMIPPMCLPDMSMNPPVLMNQATPDTTNQEECVPEDVTNDVTSSQHRKKSRDRSSNQRRDRDRSGRRSRSRDRDGNRSDRNKRNDRNYGGRERRTKWSDKDKDSPNPGLLGGMNVGNNMMMPSGMGAYPPMMPNNMMGSNMMPNMGNNMMMQQPIDQGHMQPMMMNNMMPMMDQNMMMMNQQMMMGNQPIYISSGVILPPLPGVETPTRRDKPNGCRSIFVGGLPRGVTSDILNEIFQRCGPIDDIKSPKNGAFYIRFQKPESVEQSFYFTGHRFKFHDQMENEATTIFIDYATNREDQLEYEKRQRLRGPSPPRVEPYSQTALNALTEKIKSEEEFANVAPTLATWLERGECNKKNANTFYSLVQMSNNQIRRLFNEKMQLDDEYSALKSSFRDKFARVLMQFEQVAKILSAAKHQRVSDHFTKQQRRNIEMWLKMTEEVENIREEFQATFDEDDVEKPGKNSVPLEKYEELRIENENLTYELEGYKNEAHLAKDEAERKFEKFKAHFIAQQALQNKQPVFPPLPQPSKPKPPPPLPQDYTISAPVPPSEAKLISILTAFLMVHPLGVSIEYLTSYVKSMIPNVTQVDVQTILMKYADVFECKTTGVGASIEHKWIFAAFDKIKNAN
ncbi:ecto-NOX disulfide-thiol exchanger 2-like [Epargyreus clarus]|uniref:ecto-NOX disulfide-thiol exchanger 2-like n=1 Tax=Epargyreus clarus TaxID=520877 RepID=UPI003C30B8EE